MQLKPLKRMSGAIATAFVALMLIGCRGATGQTGANGTNGTNGTNGGNGTNGATYAIDATKLTPDEWANLAPQGVITRVAVSSAAGHPVVDFKLMDSKGVPLKGLSQFTTKKSTDLVPAYPHFGFTLAKLVPENAASNSASYWVNYNVTGVATTTAGVTPKVPQVDNTGTLVDHGDGTYTYTFYRDITKSQSILDAASYTGNNLKADLGDVSFVPTLTHRLGIQFSGNAYNTGTTTPTGVANPNAPTGVPMQLAINLIYDFIPATGLAVTATDAAREIVSINNCNQCHQRLGHHGGNLARVETRYCVTCHTDQLKYGFPEATFDSANNTYTGLTRKIGGRSVFEFNAMIHAVHMGEDLTKGGYEIAENAVTNGITYPQDKQNCTKCHTATATATTPTATAQGDNWTKFPSRLACGACHDQVDWQTGNGHGVLNEGGPALNDQNCAVQCHDAATIKVQHLTTFATANNPNVPAGVANFAYDLSSVTLNANRQPVIKFQVKKDGTPVTFNTYTAGSTVMLDNFVNGPSLYMLFAVPQDNIQTPADFNVSASVSLINLWNGKGGNLFAGPDANGYYTATLVSAISNTGVATAITVPTYSSIVTGAIIGSFTQTNLPNYPYVAGDATKPGLVRPALLKKLLAAGITGNTARRAIVDTAKCNACHDQLGTNPNFHGGARNDAQACAFCHTPNRTSSGWSANASTFIHGIHGGSKRSVAFNWHAVSATETYADVTYPGKLNKCEQCHMPDTYNFATSASSAAAANGNLLWSTVATGKYLSSSTTAYTFSPYVARDSDYGVGFSFAPATGVTVPAASTTLVSSPISAACFSCHDTNTAKTHMNLNGGSIYTPRSTALNNTETCLICHGAGKIADIKVVHN